MNRKDDKFLWCPDATPDSRGMFNDLHFPAELLLDPNNKAPSAIGTIGPDDLEAQKAVYQRFQQEFATYMILNVGFIHQHTQNHPNHINEEVLLAPFDFLQPSLPESPF